MTAEFRRPVFGPSGRGTKWREAASGRAEVVCGGEPKCSEAACRVEVRPRTRGESARWRLGVRGGPASQEREALPPRGSPSPASGGSRRKWPGVQPPEPFPRSGRGGRDGGVCGVANSRQDRRVSNACLHQFRLRNETKRSRQRAGESARSRAAAQRKWRDAASIGEVFRRRRVGGSSLGCGRVRWRCERKSPPLPGSPGLPPEA